MTAPRIEHEWYGRPLPDNISVGENVYLESSYCFTRFFSKREPGLVMGEASGLYQFNSTMVAGPEGVIRVGAYTCLNNCAIVANEAIEIGAYCLIAWRVVITDSLVPGVHEQARRTSVLQEIACDPGRRLLSMSGTAPVVIQDNVWIGFDSVICGGVTIGRGAIIGCKTVVTKDVPPYAVLVGAPARIVKYLSADDTENVRFAALEAFGRPTPVGR